MQFPFCFLQPTSDSPRYTDFREHTKRALPVFQEAESASTQAGHADLLIHNASVDCIESGMLCRLHNLKN